jgi:membrane associated rhomboid family serine protease
MDALFHRNSIVPRFTIIACLICIVVFIGLHSGGDLESWEHLSRWGYFPAISVWTGKPWSLITSVFVHIEIWHIAFNLYWLWILGNCLEDAIGPWKWLAFFLGSAWVSSALQLWVDGDAGIGMSGVGYALFGFGWVARRKIVRFGEILDDHAVKTFVIWMVGCAIATQFGWINVANVAHGAGLLFGAAVAGVWVTKWKMPLSAVGLAALMAASFVPLVWCPLSSDWTSHQALEAQKKKDYPTALYWYQRTIDRDGDASWALTNMAAIYSFQGNTKAATETLAKLGELDGATADELESESSE